MELQQIHCIICFRNYPSFEYPLCKQNCIKTMHSQASQSAFQHWCLPFPFPRRKHLCRSITMSTMSSECVSGREWMHTLRVGGNLSFNEFGKWMGEDSIIWLNDIADVNVLLPLLIIRKLKIYNYNAYERGFHNARNKRGWFIIEFNFSL